MTKTFACCEWVKWIKDFLDQSQWGNDEERYQVIEFLNKASQKTTNRRIKEWVNLEGYLEPVWTQDNDYLFCEKCKKWFEQQEELQIKLIDAEIEKEKAEGKYFGPRNPKTYEGTIMEDTIKKMRKEYERREQEEQKRLNNQKLFFYKSPQE